MEGNKDWPTGRVASYDKQMMNWSFVAFFLLLIVLQGCSGISVLMRDRESLYTPQFTQRINNIKKNYREGRQNTALASLRNLADEKLNPSERAMKYNLIGVIFFSKGKFDQSINFFNQALESSQQDPLLTSRIYLNLASSYFKLGFQEKAYDTLLELDFRFFAQDEAEKYHKLRYKLSKEIGKDRDSAVSLLRALSFKNNINDLKADPHYEILLSEFAKLDRQKKFSILEELESDKALVAGYVGYLEVEKLYYFGNREDAEELLEWVQDYFAYHPEIKSLVEHFDFIMEASAKLNSKSIGLLLPLSGARKNFGLRALRGFDAAFRRTQKREREMSYQIQIKDSQGSGIVGGFAVHELVKKNHVGVIVGGLFPDEAVKEYLEARKLGVFFISLSQIYLPQEKKNHLLLELPGSVESMVNVLFSDEYLNYFGKRAAIIYPQTDRGHLFSNAFWSKAHASGVKVTDVLSYQKGLNDYRRPVKKLLGLEYIRERQEEYDLLEEIYALENTRLTRRIQTLRPQVDFDWVFIPAFPMEAIQIIPNFAYFDAFNTKLVGGPSWRSKRLSDESYKFKNIYFLGDQTTQISGELNRWFYGEYGQRIRLIEMMAFDSFLVANSLLKQRQILTRSELDSTIRSTQELGGLKGRWTQSNGLWLKNMTPLYLKNGNVTRLGQLNH